MTQQYTPMMQHYLEIKAKYPDTLVFYRLGDFYEMFFDDAKTASHELDLVLTGRNAGTEERVPMCGVPFHAVTGYIQRLINKGYKVAIVEQLEDPAEAVGLVKRDVIKVVTPGTIMDELTDERASVYLAALSDYHYGYGLAICETTTGETSVISLKHDPSLLIQTLISNGVREIVTEQNADEELVKSIEKETTITVSVCDQTDIEEQYQPLCAQIEEVHLRQAIGRLLNYLQTTQKRSMSHLRQFRYSESDQYLGMDYSTITNLELIQPSRSNVRAITLYSFLDKTRSAIGSRKLKSWISRPLRSEEKLNQRLNMIEYLNRNFIKREELKEKLSELYDIERISARIAYGSVNPKDCVRLRKSLEVVNDILDIVRESGIYPEFDSIDRCQDVCVLLQEALVEDPPLLLSDGGIFKEGYNEQLDEYHRITSDGQNWIAGLEQQEKEKTGIKNLKIGYNRVFGYYIEVSKGQVPLVKEEWGYTRKQTLTTCERYITQQLKEQEDIILHAQERAVRLENSLFSQLVEQLKQRIAALQILADALAVTDSIYALSVISSAHGYVRPEYSKEGVIDIKAGRHPILDSFKDVKYVANDIYMDNKISSLIITGPNMGGKSTYMRQCVLLAIMAQIGCYLPAKKAVLPIFDQIFTRIGSNDDILAGQSTFMMEMTEANYALQNATKDSLIIFDEIGRGTSTYDGMALAQAILEYIDGAIGAKILFSTHYHELTSLENNMEHVRNKNVAVEESDGRVTFLYKVKDGKANRSYGIHVAALAKLPDAVIERAKSLLKGFEEKRKHNNDQSQIVMMEVVPNDVREIKDILKNVDPDNMTPIEALQLVAQLKGKLKDE
ncbi:MAG: DNA mismatch repair protein MutS [Erysipelotrichaceae bacterium]|nr:DNA mismatch repair protein MutS [Erysipelotrichaceae bacterium]